MRESSTSAYARILGETHSYEFEGIHRKFCRPAHVPLAFSHSTPLLKKEWHIVSSTLFHHRFHPLRFHRPRPRSTLSADDDPLDALKVYFAKILKQRLHR